MNIAEKIRRFHFESIYWLNEKMDTSMYEDARITLSYIPKENLLLHWKKKALRHLARETILYDRRLLKIQRQTDFRHKVAKLDIKSVSWLN